MDRRRQKREKQAELGASEGTNPLTSSGTPKLTTLEVCELMCKVAKFRREGPKLLHEILTAETEAMLKWLRNLKFEIPDDQLPVMPNLPVTVIPAANSQQQQKRIQERKRLLTLISVYEMQTKCPIARIIDKI